MKISLFFHFFISVYIYIILNRNKHLINLLIIDIVMRNSKNNNYSGFRVHVHPHIILIIIHCTQITLYMEFLYLFKFLVPRNLMLLLGHRRITLLHIP